MSVIKHISERVAVVNHVPFTPDGLLPHRPAVPSDEGILVMLVDDDECCCQPDSPQQDRPIPQILRNGSVICAFCGSIMAWSPNFVQYCFAGSDGETLNWIATELEFNFRDGLFGPVSTVTTEQVDDLVAKFVWGSQTTGIDTGDDAIVIQMLEPKAPAKQHIWLMADTTSCGALPVETLQDLDDLCDAWNEGEDVTFGIRRSSHRLSEIDLINN